MKFLQTSDWHLGKFFYEHSLLEDQKYFLDQIIIELNAESEKGCPYDALVVPGDIYDRAVPPAEAVTIFNSFLNKVHSDFPALKMFFLAGNHDSASRLAFASDFLAESNVFVCTDSQSEKIACPVICGKKGEETAVYQLPFLTPLSIEAESDCEDKYEIILRTQQDLYAHALAKISALHNEKYPSMPSLICAHLFTSGSEVSDSERSFVGMAEQVDVNLFAPFSYAAVGHIHKNQAFLNGKVCYSGAPLAYSFGESDEKVMLRVCIEKKGVQVEKVPVKPLHKVVRLSGTFEEFYKSCISGTVKDELKSAYVEIQCTDSLPHENPMQLLRKGFPFILSFTRKVESSDCESGSIADRKTLLTSDAENPGAVFDMFIKEVSGIEVEISTEKKSGKTSAALEMLETNELLQKQKKIFIELLAKTETAE